MSKNKSGFLNILTILSFVGIAIYIGVGAMMIVGGSVSKQIYQEEEKEILLNTAIAQLEAEGGISNNITADYMRSGRYIRSLGILTIIWQVFCLIGVLKMRKRNKEGFALYTIGEMAVPLTVAVIINGLTAFLSAIPALIFIGLYAMHLREMHLNKTAIA